MKEGHHVEYLTAALAATLLTTVISTTCVAASRSGEARPNILWLTAEDIGTELGCYGDEYARTPCIDQLSTRGLRYVTAWSNAPVCAPARSTLISGMYPPSLGSHHMRSLVRMPDGMCMYPCYLRDAGYYCTNNSKQDYNLELTGEVWDESSRNAHWNNRQAGQPFFAIFNITTSHESRIRVRPHTLVHDPAKAPDFHRCIGGFPFRVPVSRSQELFCITHACFGERQQHTFCLRPIYCFQGRIGDKPCFAFFKCREAGFRQQSNEGLSQPLRRIDAQLERFLFAIHFS